MIDKKTDPIDQIVKKRDWLAVERLRMFRLQRAIDAYAQRIDSELQECVEAGRVLGVKINFPIWENVWKTSLEKEMARVCAVSEWTRPEQSMQKSEYATLGFDDVLTFRIADTLKDCDRQEFRVRQESWRVPRPTLRQHVLERLRSAGRKGSKAAPIRAPSFGAYVGRTSTSISARSMSANAPIGTARSVNRSRNPASGRFR